MPKRTVNTSKTSPKNLEAKEKAIEAMKLRRKEGLTYDEIALRLGYKSESGARNAVTRLLAKVEFEEVKEYRKLKLLQLDDAFELVKSVIKTPDGKVNLWAIDRIQSIIDQQSRLLGLYTLGDLNAAYDWRKEIKEAGLDPDELVNQLFSKILETQDKPRGD